MREGRAKILARRTLLQTRFWKIVEEDVVFRGKRFSYTFRLQERIVHVVAVTRGGGIVLERQYRHPVRRQMLELPAGYVNAGETPLAAARRELLEETGYAAPRWTELGSWHPSAGSSNTKVFMFLATGARRVRGTAREPFEFIRVFVRPLGEVLRQAGRSREGSAFFHFGLLLAARHPGIWAASSAVRGGMSGLLKANLKGGKPCR